MADPYLGEIRLMSIALIPKGWLPCDGRLMSVPQYSALYSLIGTHFGGDGVKTFGLPDLRGRVIVGGGGSGDYAVVGNAGGQETVSLQGNQIPTHVHPINATTATGTATAVDNAVIGTVGTVANATPAKLAYGPNPNQPLAADTITPSGGSQAHENMQPSLVMSYVIATTGIYPTRSN